MASLKNDSDDAIPRRNSLLSIQTPKLSIGGYNSWCKEATNYVANNRRLQKELSDLRERNSLTQNSIQCLYPFQCTIQHGDRRVTTASLERQLLSIRQEIYQLKEQIKDLLMLEILM